MASLRRDRRGVSPVVSKTLAIGLALLYVAGMTTALLGGVVPDYQNRAGAELSERGVATAADEIERAPPTVDGRVETRATVALPETIRNSQYTLVASNGTLELDHPSDEIHAQTRLFLPPGVTVENGTFNSGSEMVITVSGPAGNRTLSIGENG
ncbi:hypothetical protein BRC65_06415 [Halobacteriales archaeon QH_2_65_14]|nr:MAG: hypothetical protein BRC65_06415 [Halobacteriales archaeon QH_2_65_14]